MQVTGPTESSSTTLESSTQQIDCRSRPKEATLIRLIDRSFDFISNDFTQHLLFH